MGFFGKKEKKSGSNTKCKECGLELHTTQRLKRHCDKAHGNVPEKKMNPDDVGGGMW